MKCQKKTLGIFKKWQSINPPLAFIRNQNMGNKMGICFWQNIWMGSMAMGKCQNRQRNFYIVQTNYKHFERGYGSL